MTKLTWKGEDELHGPLHGGPSFMTWNGIKFPKGEAVEVSNEFMIGKARTNQFFIVSDDAKAAAPATVNDEPPAEQEAPPPPAPRRGGKFVKRKAHDDED